MGRPDLADGTEGDDDDGSGVFAPVAAARVVRFQVGIPTARPALQTILQCTCVAVCEQGKDTAPFRGLPNSGQSLSSIPMDTQLRKS